MNTNKENGSLVAVKQEKTGYFTRAIAPATDIGVLALSSAQAQAALDLSELTTQMEGVKTAVTAVIAVALTIGVAIVGWRWVKRALFSV